VIATDQACVSTRNVCAAERGIDLTGGRVLLLCYPRLFGYTFNPLSVYFCYPPRRRARAFDLRSPQHLRRYPRLRACREAGRDQRCRGQATARQTVLRLAVYRDGDALSLSGFAAGRRRQIAILETDREGPPARRDLPWPPPRLDYGGAVAFVLLAAARHLQDRRGDPLGSLAALAQRRASGAASQCRTCETCLQYRLGDWQAR